jgi:hypothetical protein
MASLPSNNFSKLFPKLSQRQAEAARTDFEDVVFIFVEKYHWTWEEICNTPIPVLLHILEELKNQHERDKHKNASTNRTAGFNLKG